MSRALASVIAGGLASERYPGSYHFFHFLDLDFAEDNPSLFSFFSHDSLLNWFQQFRGSSSS